MLVAENRLPASKGQRDNYHPGLVFADDDAGIWLYQDDCLDFREALTESFPEGKLDMVCADLQTRKFRSFN